MASLLLVAVPSVTSSFRKCLELLEEMQSNRLIPLRVQLHFEVAHCEAVGCLFGSWGRLTIWEVFIGFLNEGMDVL